MRLIIFILISQIYIYINYIVTFNNLIAVQRNPQIFKYQSSFPIERRKDLIVEEYRALFYTEQGKALIFLRKFADNYTHC